VDVVGITSVAESSRCSSPLGDYRLDGEYAQAFLAYWLANGPPE
jgi:hypothetical protein